MSAQALDHFYLLFRGQARNRSFNNSAHASLVNSNEAGIIHKRNRAHEKLAVHSVRHAAMAGNRVTKVLDLEGALQAGRKETAEWGNERRKGRENHDVPLNWSDSEMGRNMGPFWKNHRKSIIARDENRVWLAFQSRPNVGSEILRRVSTLLQL